jgi:tRNA 5-methylaminomethyl-2-thiouridine biosynthesis bifunctional protein
MAEPDDPRPAAIVPAHLGWQGDQPFSTRYGDIYHAPDGVAEVLRAFVEPQCLEQRFVTANTRFTVGELGFGTGLNCAVVAQRFIERAPPSSQLHFISVELHPLRSGEFAQMATRRRRAVPFYDELARHYPPLLPGWHRRHLCGGRICLSLFFGDAYKGLQEIRGRQLVPVDAWLLDGFAPPHNPDLWTPALWDAITALSISGTTLATFSAAGAVRRSLAGAGFQMRKIDQRPHKRHSLAGVYVGNSNATHTTPRSVVVVGAGIAGATTAWEVAQRGIAVTLLERAPDPPNRIEGAVLHCRALPDADAATQLRYASYLYACDWYDQHAASNAVAGALQFPSAGMTERRLETAASLFAHTGSWIVPVDPLTASALAGRPVNQSALYFPRARSIDMSALCEQLLCHPLIDYHCGVDVTTLQTLAESARVVTNAGIFETDQVVLCNAASANDFEQARYLEMLAVWGQIDPIELDQPPHLPLLGDANLVPLRGGWATGATYEHRPWTPERASAVNLQKFNAWWHVLTGAPPVKRLGAALRGSRAVASDRRPIVGGVYDAQFRRLPRVLLNTGHGSQGTASAPFAAECIASEFAGEFAPLSPAQSASWSSLRFRQRQARRGFRHGAFDSAQELP